MAALSLSVHSATTLARISFMYSMNAFNGFLMCGFFFSGTIKCLPTDKTNKYIFLFFIRPRLPTFVCTLFFILPCEEVLLLLGGVDCVVDLESDCVAELLAALASLCPLLFISPKNLRVFTFFLNRNYWRNLKKIKSCSEKSPLDGVGMSFQAHRIKTLFSLFFCCVL